MYANKEWLANLKVGDEVVVDSSTSLCGGLSIVKVERLTKTLISVSDGRRYRRSDGIAPGDGYSRSHIEEPTDEIREKIRRQKSATWLSRVKWDQLPTQTLSQVIEIVQKAQSQTSDRK